MSLLELPGNDVRHCTISFAGAAPGVITDFETLPYYDLGGPGLERLCYELLLSKGYEPRFFGRNGQAQLGVDLVAEKDGRLEVYQCKNLRSRPGAEDLKRYLDLFATEWLEGAGLPRPSRFVLCCPTLLRDAETDAKWLAAKDAFERRTGVEAALWHLDLLNGWLRKLPDVVADIFSDEHARAFCEIDDWKADLFVPLREGASGDRRLRRYFQSRNSGRLYVDAERERKIAEAVERSPVVLVRGLPGTGKTFTALAVAERLRDARQRTYFVDVGDDELTKPQLKEGIRARVSRRSVFVLENCHERIDVVAEALEDLAPLLASGRASVICLARRVPGPIESRSDDFTFYSELETLDATIDFENDDELLHRVVNFWRPELVGLSRKRLAKLIALCGRDLFLLDEVLHRLASPADLDELSPSAMYNMVRLAYLGHKTADNFRVTCRLAALAQFDIHPRADVLRPSAEELALLESFCVRAGQPPRWHFLHSTAAELVLHAIWSGMGVTESTAVAEQAAADVSEYFRDVMDASLRPASSTASLYADFREVMRNALKLSGREGSMRLKAAVLDSEPIQELTARFLASPGHTRIISLIAFIAQLSNPRSSEHYARLLSDTLHSILVPGDRLPDASMFNIVGLMLRTLEKLSPDLHAELNRKVDASHLLDVIETNGNINELFRILQYASPDLARALVQNLDDERIERLVATTIALKRSIGTINLSIRAIARRPELGDLAQTLERKIGAARFLRLIDANGTVRELFKVLQYTSPDVAREVVAELDEMRLERMIEKVIADGRSIGTISFTLRELRLHEETVDVVHDLERKLGAERFLRLIEHNGTLLELFSILKYGSPELGTAMLRGLAGERMTRLIDETIASRRSIGTLDFALRALKFDANMAAIGSALAQAIGPADFVRLIVANGTIFELFRIIDRVPFAFGRELVDAVTDAAMNRLIDKTLASGRSIGTLNFTLRALRRNHHGAAIASSLEQKVGVAGFWRLMIGNGSPGPFVDLMRDVTPSFREQVFAAASTVTDEQWDRIVARGDFLQLCELISDAQPLFDDPVTGPRLLAAVVAHAPTLVRTSNWLQRRGGAQRLISCPESPAKTAASRALESLMAEVEPQAFPASSLRETVSGVALLYQARPDLRPRFPSLMREWLPSAEEWTLDPQKDKHVPRILLRLLASPELSDDDADEFVGRLLQCLTRELVSRFEVHTVLWTLWALFVCARTRTPGLDPRVLGESLPSEFVMALTESFAARVAQRHGVDERRAQFALLGLFTLLGIRTDPAPRAILRAELIRHGDAATWRLCANQSFVTAWLVLHGGDVVRTLAPQERAWFRQRLLTAAEEYTERDAATESLLEL